MAFLGHFLRALVAAKTRQGLLLMAVFALALSSFSLLVLRSTMGGLQHNLRQRSQEVLGLGEIRLPDWPRERAQKLLEQLRARDVVVHAEWEIELLLRHGQQVSQAMVHAIPLDGPYPPFLPPLERGQVYAGEDLTRLLQVGLGDQLVLISPAHTDEFLGDVPRQMALHFGQSLWTQVPEVDRFHAWLSWEDLINLTGSETVNRLRYFTPLGLGVEVLRSYDLDPEKVVLTWEDQHESLVYALNLETLVMSFLFICMTCLVSIAITAALLIFFDKVSLDLMSFWILGLSQKSIERLSLGLIHLISALSALSGLGAALVVLALIDRYSHLIMPDVFVEPKIPVHITASGVLLAFVVPYVVSALFGMLAMKNFSRERPDYLSLIRGVSGN